MKQSTFYSLLFTLTFGISLFLSFGLIFGFLNFDLHEFRNDQLTILFLFITAIAARQWYCSFLEERTEINNTDAPTVITLKSGVKLQPIPGGSCMKCPLVDICCSGVTPSEMDFSNSPIEVTKYEMQSLENNCICNNWNYKVISE